jgi:protease-4
LSAVALEPIYFPDYYLQSDFLTTTPGVAGDAAEGFFNPAVYGMLKSPEMAAFWNDREQTPGQMSNFALMVGGRGLCFGLQSWTYEELVETEIEKRDFNDYKIGFGFGDDKFTMGLGYGWSAGDLSSLYPRDNVVSLGLLSRPCKHASIGLSGHLPTGQENFLGILDLGVRPLGTPTLTLFGEGVVLDHIEHTDFDLAGGISAQPIPGLALQGKYFNGGAFNIGMAFSFYDLKAIFLPHFDKENKSTYNTYGAVWRMRPYKDSFAPEVRKNNYYLEIKLNAGLKYQRYRLFDTKGYTLTEMLKTLDEVKNNPAAAGIAINLTEDFYGSWHNVWEVRSKLQEVREAGKKVVVYFERGGMGAYYLASVADKIMIDPNTLVSMQGFNMGRSFIRNMLDKLGIGVDEWRYFTYKSAYETLSRTSMSPADKEQRKAMIEDFYKTYRADICASRKITEAEFDHIVDEVSIMDADSMLFYHLADTTGRWDQMKDYIKSLEGKDKKMIDTKTFAKTQPLCDHWSEPPKIAIIYGLGECSMNSGITARSLGPLIKRVREDKSIKAVVFRADSPGGDILPSEIVTQELRKTAKEKPVIVSQGQVAGSGGYYISMYGNKIVASPWTITGSIGVIGGWIYNNGFNEKIGLSYDHTQVGKHADLGSGAAVPFIGVGIPERNLTTEEREYVGRMILKWYDEFTKKVAEGRNLPLEKVQEIAQGRVWSGLKGKEIGLVDEIGGLEKAVQMAKEAAGIKPGEIVKIVQMPDLGWINPEIFQPKLFGMKAPVFQADFDHPDVKYYRAIAESKGGPLLMTPPEYYIDMLEAK